jgi:hypothetical protein
MITLLGALLGFVGSLLPDVFKAYSSAKDREHELAVMDRQMELQKLGLSQRVEEIRTAATTELYRTYNVGVRWVDAFNGTVRPALAYAFFMLYAAVKLSQYHLLAGIAAPFDMLNLLWGEEDQAIFAAIISFYFGQRAMGKR